MPAVSPETPANMEDTHPQSDKGIATDQNQMSRMDEERLADSMGDHNLLQGDRLTTHQIPTTGNGQFSCIQCDKIYYALMCLP